jgi:hypothetical protein
MNDIAHFEIPAGHALEIKIAPNGVGSSFEGFLVRYNEPDASGDTFAPGAFTASLAAIAASGNRVPLLWQHDQRQPIGSWTQLQERPDGVWGTGVINTSVLQGRTALSLIQAGDVSGLSVGFVTKKRRGSTILEADLMEGSLVSIPAASKARITLKNLQNLGELAAALQSGQPWSRRDAEFIARRAWQGVGSVDQAAIETLAARIDAATVELKTFKGK